VSGGERRGIEALRMDVVAAPGASVCDVEGTPQVLTPTGLDDGSRHFAVEIPVDRGMRLYLLDLPGRHGHRDRGSGAQLRARAGGGSTHRGLLRVPHGVTAMIDSWRARTEETAG
jgi:hypothetical protein